MTIICGFCEEKPAVVFSEYAGDPASDYSDYACAECAGVDDPLIIDCALYLSVMFDYSV